MKVPRLEREPNDERTGEGKFVDGLRTLHAEHMTGAKTGRDYPPKVVSALSEVPRR